MLFALLIRFGQWAYLYHALENYVHLIGGISSSAVSNTQISSEHRRKFAEQDFEGHGQEVHCANIGNAANDPHAAAITLRLWSCSQSTGGKV